MKTYNQAIYRLASDYYFNFMGGSDNPGNGDGMEMISWIYMKSYPTVKNDVINRFNKIRKERSS